MIRCPRCGAELEDGTRFCSSCGSTIEEQTFCPNCGAQTSAAYANCQNCGAPLAGAGFAPADQQPKKSPKKILIYAGIGLAALALLILVISLIAGGSKKGNSYAMYVKDDEIFFSNLKKDPAQITSELLSDDGSFLTADAFMTEDGKYLIFPDKVDDDGTCAYYITKASKPGAEATKIDSNIEQGSAELNGNYFTYAKDDGDALYQYNIAKDSKEKIDEDVEYIFISEDGKTLYYAVAQESKNSGELSVEDEYSDYDYYDSVSYDLYLKKAGKDAEKIAGDVDSLEGVTEDFSTIYFVKDESLYKQKQGKDKEKIADDVYSVPGIYDSGEMFYVTCEEDEKPMMDIINDDMPADDYDAEWIRESLEEETIDMGSKSLFYYDGSKETLITADYNGYCCVAADRPVLLYTGAENLDIKINLSDIEYSWDIYDKISEQKAEASEFYIAIGDKASTVKIEEETASRFRIDDAGTAIYYFDEISEEDQSGDLYRIEVSKKSAGDPKQINSDVYTGRYGFLEDGRFCYFVDYSKDAGELYVDEDKIDDDVYSFSISYAALNTLYYFKDYDEDDYAGKLCRLDGKKSKDIAEDVHTFEPLPDGRILLLTEYSTKHYEGTLNVWKNGKLEKIDEDVSRIFSVHAKSK